MKIIHTADLHLGMHPDKGQPWSEERASALWGAFDRICAAADRERADLLLIAGDFFHSSPLLRDLRQVSERLSALRTARTVIIAGNHDCISPHSHYRDFRWPDNVTFLAEDTMQTVDFPELNAQVHGFSYWRTDITQPLYDHLSVPRDGQIHILLGHGGDARHIPIDMERVAAAGYNYAAFGHIHKPQLHEDLRLAWCGSPEPVDCTDIGERGYIIADVTLHSTRLRFIPDCSSQYIPLTVAVTPDTTREGLRHVLQQSIDEDGDKNIYLILLEGTRSPDTDFSSPVSLDCRLARWTDHTKVSLDPEILKREHSGDLLGYFLEEIDRLPDGDLKNRACMYGIEACLGEKEKP